MSLKDTAKKFEGKLKKIKVMLFDVDGILTDGLVWWASEEVGFNRKFNIYDGYGMRLLMRHGIKVGIVTGGNSVSVEKRASQLKLDFCYMGNEDKRDAYLDIMKKYQVTDEEILYMGDELFDMPLLKRAGFSATVPNASEEVREIVDYVSTKESGMGCAREVMDLVRYSQNVRPFHEEF